MIIVKGNNNRIYNNGFNRNSNKNDENPLGFFMVVVPLVIITFFQNIHLIFLIFGMSSFTLIFFLSMNSLYHFWQEDESLGMENVFSIIFLIAFLAVGLFIRDGIPMELIQVYQDMNIMDFIFNNRMSDYGRNLSFDITLSTLLVFLALIINGYQTFKKLFYGYIFERKNGMYFFSILNIGLLVLSMYVFQIGVFR